MSRLHRILAGVCPGAVAALPALAQERFPGQAIAILRTQIDGYWGFIPAGSHRHREMSEPDQGPILTADSSWSQPSDVPHADPWVGPENCVTLVIFEDRADFIPVQ
ncbi:MAG: hypothetical protein WBA67_09535 [Jannaschia sp.]